MWEIFSRDQDNSNPWYVVRKEDGVKYPSHINGQKPILYREKSEAVSIRNKLNSEEEQTKTKDVSIQTVFEYDPLTQSLYKTILKLKIKDLIKEYLQKDIIDSNIISKLQDMFGSIDNISSIEGFEKITNDLLDY